MIDPVDDRTPDLFDPIAEPPSEPQHQIPPSESVFCDMGEEALVHIGEVQLPRPMPVELVIEVDGWDYFFKLDRRQRSQ